MILWIEDSPAIWQHYADILRHSGHEVVFATNPMSAIDILQANCEQICLVILDVVMPSHPKPDFLDIPDPRATGLIIGEHIAQTYPDIQIIVFTVYRPEELVGIGDVVLKILNKSHPSDLIDTIRNIEE